MLALREFFWGPWPPPLPPNPPPCGDITVISSFVVSSAVVPPVLSPIACYQVESDDFVVTAPLSVPQSNEPGLPVCTTKFVVGVKEN